MKHLITLTIIYFAGLLLFLLTGMVQLNWLFYAAIALGIAGIIGLIGQRIRKRKRSTQ